MTWQPIETAPKDGTAILVADFLNEEPKVRFPLISSACWVVSEHIPEWRKGTWVGSLFEDFTGFKVRFEPTHWQPLPNVEGHAGYAERRTAIGNDPDELFNEGEGRE